MTEDSSTRGGAVVTGAAGRIGRAIVSSLVADGYRVAAVDVVDSADAFADLIEAGDVVPVVVDLGSSEGRALAVDAARRGVGPVRCLVNNAADVTENALLASTDDEWRSSLETNVIAPVALVRMLFEDLRGGGVVVNISSIRGLRCIPGAAAYEASKSGLLAVTRSIAAELGPHGVRAVSVCPGAIVDDPATWLDELPEGYRDSWTATQPMGLAGSTADIAAVVSFLCSDAGGHVNGVELVVDGGAAAQHPVTPALRMTGHLRVP